MATITNGDVRPDRNSPGKASFIIGLLSLILSFIPFIGFVSWLLAPLAVLFGLIALRRPSKSLAIAGVITGVIALVICFSWLNATKSVGEAMSADTFNNTGGAVDLANAPIIEASARGLWGELEDNKIAAGQKYGGKRLRFTNEEIAEFEGDAANPQITIIGDEEGYLIHFVRASFSAEDGTALSSKKKGDSVSFVCTKINKTFGGGYNLAGCKLS